MIHINQEIENQIKSAPLDNDCDSLARIVDDICGGIEKSIDAGMFDLAVDNYLQLLKSVSTHFVEDEHWCYFDDLYSPDYVLQDTFRKMLAAYRCGKMGKDAFECLKLGLAEIAETESYRDYGSPLVCSMI